MEKDFLSGKDISSLLHKRTFTRFCILVTIFVLLLPLISPPGECANDSQCHQYVCLSQTSFYISRLDITLNVRSPTNISIIEQYSFVNSLNVSADYIDLNLNMSYENLVIENTDNQARLNFELLGSSESIRIHSDSPIESNDTYTMKLYYDLANELPLFPNKPSYYMFSYITTLSCFVEQARVTCRLPEYAYLHETDDFPPYSPYNITANFISGTRIVIIWDFHDLIEDSVLDLHVFFDDVSKSTPVWLFIIGPFVGVTLGVTASFYYFRRKDQKNAKKIGDLFLTDVQKQLLKQIHIKGGKLSQAELCKITGYTRTRVSRNLISLEQQGLIKREKWGKNFQLYLEDLGRKVIE